MFPLPPSYTEWNAKTSDPGSLQNRSLYLVELHLVGGDAGRHITTSSVFSSPTVCKKIDFGVFPSSTRGVRIVMICGE